MARQNWFAGNAKVVKKPYYQYSDNVLWSPVSINKALYIKKIDLKKGKNTITKVDDLGIVELDSEGISEAMLFYDETSHLFGYLPRSYVSHFFVIDLKNCKLDSIIDIPDYQNKQPLLVFTYKSTFYYLEKRKDMRIEDLEKTKKLKILKTGQTLEELRENSKGINYGIFKTVNKAISSGPCRI